MVFSYCHLLNVLTKFMRILALRLCIGLCTRWAVKRRNSHVTTFLRVYQLSVRKMVASFTAAPSAFKYVLAIISVSSKCTCDLLPVHKRIVNF